MLIQSSSTKRPCNKCAGFGVFDKIENETKLVPCPKCSSVHPETYGLKYWNTADTYFYVVKSKIANIFADIELSLKK
jgi:hypothetical protein